MLLLVTLIVIAVITAIGAVVANGRDAPAETGGEWVTIASDAFERPAASGWSPADSGGEYALSVPRHFATTGTAGRATPPRRGSSLTATLGAVASLDTLASATVTVPQLPTSGNGIYAGLIVRSTANSHYLATVRIATGGAVYVSVLRQVGASQTAVVRDIRVATAVAAGESIHMQFSAVGDSPVELRARAWTASTEEQSWQANVIDDSDERLTVAGAVGMWTYASSGSDPQAVTFDDFEAWRFEKRAPTASPTPENPGDPDDPDEPDEPGDPTPTIDGVRGTPGAGAVGAATYPVPERAIFVSTGGNDTNPGTELAPFASLPAAIKAASGGDTIVMREGNYHGSVIIPKHKSLTIQSFPGEEVWLDGSREVTEWSRDGAHWVLEGWDIRFDSSPTYRRGAPDGTQPGWQFVNPDFPMAAHPDQVWINGEAQRQVSSLTQLEAGKFFVDYASERLYLGSNPAGKEVRAADSVRALTIAGPGSTVRGIGIRRFSPSVPDIGAVAVSGVGSTLERVTITDMATTGLAIFASDVKITDVTISRSGMLGAQASTADRLSATGLLIDNNNTERFNRAPVSGGFKIHKSRGVTVTDSAFLGNRGNGLWFDESVFDMTIAGNDIIGSVGNGLVIELSAKAIVADNIIAESSKDGILISDSGHVAVWNNTISDNDRSLNIVQGTRRASNLALPGHDPRQPLPDPTVTWITEDISIGNNVFANGRGKCVLCVEDYSHERSADQMRVRSNGNVIHRESASKPAWAIVWSRGVGNPRVFTSVAAFTAATGHESESLALDGRPALAGVSLSPEVVSAMSAVAQPLPADIAIGTGRPAGVRQLGAWE